ncbi:MAG: hypothetical protein R6V04_08065 [bacterium]
MKKNIFKNLIVLVLSISLLVIFCDKNSTDSNGDSETTDFSALVGTWLSQSATVDAKLETNSNQTANDFLSEANGAISVTDGYLADLKYIVDLPMEDTRIILISEDMMLTALLKPTATTSMLFFSLSSLSQNVMYQVLSDADSTYYFGDIDDFTISETQAQVTANNATFISGFGSTNSKLNTAGNTAQVILDGIITANTISISANDPTSILPFPIPIPAEDMGTVTLNQDSTFTAEFTIEDFVEVDTSITGSWSVKNDKLILGPPEGEEGEPLEFDYSLQGGNLTLTSSIGISEFLDDVETEDIDVMELLESFFGLDTGSLVDVIIDIEIVMSKGTSKLYLKKSKKSPWFNDEYRNQMISRILHKMNSLVNRDIEN